MKTPSLDFSPAHPLVRKTAPVTSKRAWASIQGARETQFKRIYRVVLFRPMTCGELCAVLRMKWTSCSARLNELVGVGILRDTGEERENQRVLEVTPAWRQADE